MATLQHLRVAADRLIELHEEGDLDAALALADELASEAEASDDEVARESLFVARFERAMVLIERDEYAAAAEAFGSAAETPTDPDDPDQRHEVAMALLHRGMCLDTVGDTEAAIEAYDQVVRRFGAADDLVTRDQVLRAQVNRAASRLAGGAAATAADEAGVLRADLDPSAPLGAEQWLLASRIHAAALQELGRHDDARAVLIEALAVDLDDPAVIEQRELAEQDLRELD